MPLLGNTAKSIASRGRKIAFLNPQDNVLDMFELAGVPQMNPIHTIAELTA